MRKSFIKQIAIYLSIHILTHTYTITCKDIKLVKSRIQLIIILQEESMARNRWKNTCQLVKNCFRSKHDVCVMWHHSILAPHFVSAEIHNFIATSYFNFWQYYLIIHLIRRCFNCLLLDNSTWEKARKQIVKYRMNK